MQEIRTLTALVHKKWVQVYRGIRIEVAHWGESDPTTGTDYEINNGRGIWNYYLSLPEQAFTEEEFEKLWLKGDTPDKFGRVYYNYFIFPFDYLNFHGGVTFYEKRRGHDGDARVVKVGCDYSHACDEGGYFEKQLIFSDACDSVDCLHEIYPTLKRRCNYYGKFYLKEEGELTSNGAWQSFEAHQKWKEEHSSP